MGSFGATKFIVIAFLSFIYLSLYTDCSPVILDNNNEFKDDWDYHIKTHQEPLLNGSVKSHVLPPINSIKIFTSKESSPKKARVAGIIGDVVRSRVSCPTCKLGVGLLEREIKNNTPYDEIKVKFVNLCVAFNVESQLICTGIFDVYGPEVVPVMKKIRIGASEICSMVLGETCGEVENPMHKWSVEFNVNKPELTERELPKPGLPTFKVLQISDTHFDPEYTVGSISNCKDPLCCRENSTPPDFDEPILAGKWGSYKKCDTPLNLLENMFKHIAETHNDIDYILWTGDLPPHDIWKQTRSGNSDVIRATVELLYRHFPTTPVFPALGNHEASPAGNFPPPWAPPEHDIEWLYSLVVDQWRMWLPASAGETVAHGGFYSVLVRPGFRILGLNTNYCHTLSWWLLLNSTDPAHELKWLVYELQQAENKGEKVHLIGHIPPGNYDCMKVWSENFYEIVNRFEDTIVAQFYGHTHADEFELFYDIKEFSRATNVAYLAPSVTTYEDFNPAYRIYYIDGDHNETTREVIDHETWTTDLSKANDNDIGEPEWYKLYSAKDAYGLESLRPDAWSKLQQKLVHDSDLFDLFYKYYFRDSPTRPSCDDPTCKLQILCDLKSGKSHNRRSLCNDLELDFGVESVQR